MSDQNKSQFFDSHTVSEFYGKFSGTIFDVNSEVAKHFKFDDLIYFVVAARVDNSSFGMTKNGNIKRTNTFKVHQVYPVDVDDKFECTLSVESQNKNSVVEEVSDEYELVGQLPISFPQDKDLILSFEDDDDNEHKEVEDDDIISRPTIKHSKDPVLQKFLEVN